MTLQHAVEMFQALHTAELAIVPGTSHFLTQEKPDLVNRIVLDFLTLDPGRQSPQSGVHGKLAPRTSRPKRPPSSSNRTRRRA